MNLQTLAKRTLKKDRHEKEACLSPDGLHRCHIPLNHKGDCACEHGNIWGDG